MVDPLFQSLVSVPSVSGNEKLFQKLVDNALKSISPSSYEDILGNHITKIGSGNNKVMITAHADEVGFIVTYISNEGFVYVQPVGGIDADVAVGQVVTVQTKSGPITGIIGRAENWTTASSKNKDNDEITPFSKLWIDLGAKNKVNELVALGDLVNYQTSVYELPDSHVLARGADNKLGVYSVIKTAQVLSQEINDKITLYAATTAQEEVGSRGVPPVVAHVQPNISVIIDTMAATDTPAADIEEMGHVQLGFGPTISRGSNTNAELFTTFKQVAEREKIPFQVEAEPGATATDADAFQITGAGSSTIIIGIPVRYMHFPAQVFSWQDVDNCIKLIHAFLKNL